MRSTISSIGLRLRALSDRAEGILLWVFAVLLLADVLLGILARYVDFQVVFADELGKYFFIWLCAIGISAATKDNQHVRLNFIAARLPLNPKFVRITSQLLFLAFSLFYFYWTCRLTWMHFVMDKSVMGFRFPMYLFTAALPFGFALTSVRLIEDIVSVVKKNGSKEVSGPESHTIKER
jgi:TRAP-type C4-dicarboxylate transport system permease small subunit